MPAQAGRRTFEKMVRECLLRCASLGLVFGLSGCFFDSRWGQQKALQKHEVARQTPHQLGATSHARSSRISQRSLRIRVYATPTYSSTVVNWQKQFEETLECANSVFTPEFGASFEVAEFVAFRPQADEEKLTGLLAELTAKDSAADVDWVVGLARAVPQFAASADDLGLAPLLGNHFVMRAMSDAHEYEAIQRAFTEVSEEERRKLYHTRKQHKLCTVFLHEVAHTLGVPHERSDGSLMHPRYQVKSHGYSDETAEVVRDSLRVRASLPTPFLDRSFAQLLQTSMSATNADWEKNSRDDVLRQVANFERNNAALAGTGTRGITPAPTPTNPRGVTPATAPSSGPSTAGLTSDEQETYARALAELHAGHASAAQQLAAPLLAKQPRVPAVQSLRCEIAMAIGGDWDKIQHEDCDGLAMAGAFH